jgi:transcriptional regulator with XRE-family HTH domain
MHMLELGCRIRRARQARGLTQARLASQANLSRITLNQLENGLFRDLGIRKVQSVLRYLGLEFALQEAGSHSQDFLRIATTTANVSFKNLLTEDELVRALLTGKVPPSRRPHFRVLLEEASAAILRGLIGEINQWTKSGKIEKNLARIARDLGIKELKLE